MSEEGRAAEGDLTATYLGFAAQALAELRSQMPRIHQAGDLLAETRRRGGALVVARTGHTLHSELIGRAGGPGRSGCSRTVDRSISPPTGWRVWVGRIWCSSMRTTLRP